MGQNRTKQSNLMDRMKQNRLEWNRIHQDRMEWDRMELNEYNEKDLIGIE